MLWNLGVEWLLIAVAVVAILSFIVAMALHAVMGEDGFGATGNAVIITIGFFLTLFVADNVGYRMDELTFATATGIFGAFTCLIVLAMLKAALNRF